MDHKILEPIFVGLLSLNIFGDKVAISKRPCHLPGIPFQHIADLPVVSYDVRLSRD